MAHDWRPDGSDKVGVIRRDTQHVPSSQGNTAGTLDSVIIARAVLRCREDCNLTFIFYLLIYIFIVCVLLLALVLNY